MIISAKIRRVAKMWGFGTRPASQALPVGMNQIGIPNGHIKHGRHLRACEEYDDDLCEAMSSTSAWPWLVN